MGLYGNGVFWGNSFSLLSSQRINMDVRKRARILRNKIRQCSHAVVMYNNVNCCVLSVKWRVEIQVYGRLFWWQLSTDLKHCVQVCVFYMLTKICFVMIGDMFCGGLFPVVVYFNGWQCLVALVSLVVMFRRVWWTVASFRLMCLHTCYLLNWNDSIVVLLHF